MIVKCAIIVYKTADFKFSYYLLTLLIALERELDFSIVGTIAPILKACTTI